MTFDAAAAEALGAAFGATSAGTTLDLLGLFLLFMSFVTFFKPEVTPSPLLRAAKSPVVSAAGAAGECAGAPAGGGGPEGAEGAAAEEPPEGVAEEASPPRGFHDTPVVWFFLM